MIRHTPLKRSQKPLKRTPLRRVSKKLSGELRLYSKLRKEFLESHPYCWAHLIIVPTAETSPPAQDIHHVAKRGKLLNDTTLWMPVCRQCHNFIHQHPTLARALNLLK